MNEQQKERILKRCQVEVQEAYRAYAAKTRLDKGFGGMGVNIVQEKATRLPSYLRTLKRLGEQLCSS